MKSALSAFYQCLLHSSVTGLERLGGKHSKLLVGNRTPWGRCKQKKVLDASKKHQEDVRLGLRAWTRQSCWVAAW